MCFEPTTDDQLTAEIRAWYSWERRRSVENIMEELELSSAWDWAQWAAEEDRDSGWAG